MAFLLADAAKLTQNMLVRGVIETLIAESSVLQYLPFLTVTGSGVAYNQERQLATAEWHAVNDTWQDSELGITQAVAGLKILGGDADVDSFLQQTYADKNDIQALVVQSKAKSVAYAFNQAFFYGDSSRDPNQFDGLATQAGVPVAGYAGLDATHRAFAATANGAPLALDQMDQLIDAVKPGKPDALFMSKRSRRKLSNLRRASGNLLETGVDAFGRRAMFYDGIPIGIDENIADGEDQGTSTGVCSSIFAVKFGFQTGVCGLQNGMISALPVGPLETKDAVRTRIKWYVGLAIFRPIAYARLAGVKD
ncbi:MAG TPA: phage major capsid protein [Chloroflexia bacterium]|nr:phage major capsid protein [Chloroflexia bacterium]